MVMGIGIDNNEPETFSGDISDAYCSQFLSFTSWGGEISSVGLRKNIFNFFGNPCFHSAKAVASMNNNIKVASKCQLDQIPFNSFHISSS